MTLLLESAEAQIQQQAVYSLATTTSSLFAARASGLYRSVDGGNSWHDALASLAPDTFTVTAVAAAGVTVLSGANGVILRSEDEGASWAVVGLSSPAPHVVALVLSPDFVSDGIAFAGTAEDGVFISSDWGASWAAWNFGLFDFNVYALAVSPAFSTDRTVLAGTESGIFRSQNGGRGWVDLPFPTDDAPVLSLACLGNELTVFAGTEKHGLFVSANAGASWEAANEPLRYAAVNALQVVGGVVPTVYLLLEDRLLTSFDGGASWAQRAAFAPDKLAISMLVHPVSGTVTVGFVDGDILQISASGAETL